MGVKSFEDLEPVFRQEILPLLQEYFHGDWHKIQLVLRDLTSSEDVDLATITPCLLDAFMQAYAYSREYDCPRVVLLFPRWGRLRSQVATYRLSPGDGDSAIIEIAAVDVSSTAGNVCKQLKATLRGTFSGAEDE